MLFSIFLITVWLVCYFSDVAFSALVLFSFVLYHICTFLFLFPFNSLTYFACPMLLSSVLNHISTLSFPPSNRLIYFASLMSLSFHELYFVLFIVFILFPIFRVTVCLLFRFPDVDFCSTSLFYHSFAFSLPFRISVWVIFRFASMSSLSFREFCFIFRSLSYLPLFPSFPLQWTVWLIFRMSSFASFPQLLFYVSFLVIFIPFILLLLSVEWCDSFGFL